MQNNTEGRSVFFCKSCPRASRQTMLHHHRIDGSFRRLSCFTPCDLIKRACVFVSHEVTIFFSAKPKTLPKVCRRLRSTDPTNVEAVAANQNKESARDTLILLLLLTQRTNQPPGAERRHATAANCFWAVYSTMAIRRVILTTNSTAASAADVLVVLVFFATSTFAARILVVFVGILWLNTATIGTAARTVVSAT